MENGKIVLFKGTKSRGNSWGTFIEDSHFYPRTRTDIYGVVYAIQGSDIWVYVHENKTHKLLDTCTWGFKKEDLEKE